MKKYIIGIGMFLSIIALPASASATIAFGSALGLAEGATSPLSITGLEVTGNDRIILVGVGMNEVGTASINYDDGAGGGAQAFTQLGTYRDTSGGGSNSLWYLVAPTTGSGRRIVATFSGSSYNRMGAIYYTGVAQTSVFTTATGTVDTTSPGADLDTSDTDGSWQVGFARADNANLSLTGGTDRQHVRAAVTDGILADSNATVANTVSNTFTWSWGGGDTAWTSAMMRPSPPPPTNITGSGTTNRLAKFTSSTSIGDSLFSDDGSNTTLTSGNLFFQAGALLETVSPGALMIGSTTATSISIGRPGGTVTLFGPATFQNFTGLLATTTSLSSSTICLAGDCRTTWPSASSSASSFSWPFTKQGNGSQATTTLMGFFGGFISTASSTLQNFTASTGTTTNMFSTNGGITTLTVGTLKTSSNCSSSASPAVCGSAPAGSVAMVTGVSTLAVNTSAVTANSQIIIQEDSSLGTRLGITCNTTTGRSYTVNARTSGTSFTIKSSANPATNKACLSYLIVN